MNIVSLGDAFPYRQITGLIHLFACSNVRYLNERVALVMSDSSHGRSV